MQVHGMLCCVAFLLCHIWGAEAVCTTNQYCPANGNGCAVKVGCLDCPAGYYNGTENAETCSFCPEGQYSSNKGMGCEDCAAGKYANHSEFMAQGKVPSSCFACPPGYFSEVKGQTTCKKCKAGSSSKIGDSSGAADCTPCHPGRYSADFMAFKGTCNACQSGSITDTGANAGAVNCTGCGPGKYSTGALSCTSCDLGRYHNLTGQTTESACVGCPKGHITNGDTGASVCTVCGAGQFSNGNSTQCEKCPRGSITSGFAHEVADASTSKTIYVLKKKACVTASNIGDTIPKQTVEQCKKKCDADQKCVAIEYGGDYTQLEGAFKPQDCKLNSKSDTSGCNGNANNLDTYVKVARSSSSSYSKIPRGCVNGNEMISHDGKTVDECIETCDNEDKCRSFEYGVDYGGANPNKNQVGLCQLNSNADASDCDGGQNNVDLYIKPAAYCDAKNGQDVKVGTFVHIMDRSSSSSDAAAPATTSAGMNAIRSSSDLDCSEKCTANPSCTVWVRQPSTGDCWLSKQSGVIEFSDAKADRHAGLRLPDPATVGYTSCSWPEWYSTTPSSCKCVLGVGQSLSGNSNTNERNAVWDCNGQGTEIIVGQNLIYTMFNNQKCGLEWDGTEGGLQGSNNLNRINAKWNCDGSADALTFVQTKKREGGREREEKIYTQATPYKSKSKKCVLTWGDFDRSNLGPNTRNAVWDCQISGFSDFGFSFEKLSQPNNTETGDDTILAQPTTPDTLIAFTDRTGHCDSTKIRTGATMCTTCPLGQYSSSSIQGTCTVCAAGRYHRPNMTAGTATSPSSCISCEAGFHASANATVAHNCTRCRAGSVTDTGDVAGATMCTWCGVGKYSLTSAAVSCSNCTAGRYNPKHGASNASMCVKCTNGSTTYPIRDGASDCTACDAGRYMLEARDRYLECLKCKPGTFQLSQARGSSLETDCIRCGLGRFSEEEGLVYHAGYNDPAITSDDLPCLQCYAGKYNDLLGANLASDCLNCAVGKFANPQILVHTKVQLDLDDDASTSARRQLAMITGKTYGATCMMSYKYKNKAGTHTITGGCTAMDDNGQDTHTDNKWCATKVDANSVFECNKDTGCSKPDNSWDYCPSPTPSPTPAPTPAEYCSTCPDGKYFRHSMWDDFCSDRPIPHQFAKFAIREIVAKLNQVYVLESGENLNANTEKTAASAAFLYGSSNKGVLTCAEAKKNGFCDTPQGDQYCKRTCGKCASSSTSALPGCTLCPGGKFSTISKGHCDLCPAGYYHGFEGRSHVDACIKCEPGSAPTAGSDPRNYVSSGATRCNKCPVGHYAHISAVTSKVDVLSWTCKACSPGKYITVTGTADETLCISCSIGRYSGKRAASDSNTCLPCPAGRYSKVAASSTPDHCIRCISGTYSTERAAGTENTCISCPAETFSNPGSARAADCQEKYQVGFHYKVVTEDKDFDSRIQLAHRKSITAALNDQLPEAKQLQVTSVQVKLMEQVPKVLKWNGRCIRNCDTGTSEGTRRLKSKAQQADDGVLDWLEAEIELSDKEHTEHERRRRLQANASGTPQVASNTPPSTYTAKCGLRWLDYIPQQNSIYTKPKSRQAQWDCSDTGAASLVVLEPVVATSNNKNNNNNNNGGKTKAYVVDSTATKCYLRSHVDSVVSQSSVMTRNAKWDCTGASAGDELERIGNRYYTYPFGGRCALKCATMGNANAEWDCTQDNDAGDELIFENNNIYCNAQRVGTPSSSSTNTNTNTNINSSTPNTPVQVENQYPTPPPTSAPTPGTTGVTQVVSVYEILSSTTYHQQIFAYVNVVGEGTAVVLSKIPKSAAFQADLQKHYTASAGRLSVDTATVAMAKGTVSDSTASPTPTMSPTAVPTMSPTAAPSNSTSGNSKSKSKSFLDKDEFYYYVLIPVVVLLVLICSLYFRKNEQVVRHKATKKTSKERHHGAKIGTVINAPGDGAYDEPRKPLQQHQYAGGQYAGSTSVGNPYAPRSLDDSSHTYMNNEQVAYGAGPVALGEIHKHLNPSYSPRGPTTTAGQQAMGQQYNSSSGVTRGVTSGTGSATLIPPPRRNNTSLTPAQKRKRQAQQRIALQQRQAQQQQQQQSQWTFDGFMKDVMGDVFGSPGTQSQSQSPTQIQAQRQRQRQARSQRQRQRRSPVRSPPRGSRTTNQPTKPNSSNRARGNTSARGNGNVNVGARGIGRPSPRTTEYDRVRNTNSGPPLAQYRNNININRSPPQQQPQQMNTNASRLSHGQQGQQRLAAHISQSSHISPRGTTAMGAFEREYQQVYDSPRGRGGAAGASVPVPVSVSGMSPRPQPTTDLVNYTQTANEYREC